MDIGKFLNRFGILLASGLLMFLPLAGRAAMTRAGYINIAYQQMLDRRPNDLETAAGLKAYAGFTVFKRVLNRLPEREQAIKNIYQGALKRDPLPAELKTLKRFLTTSDQLRKQLFESKERKTAVTDLYKKYICRPPRKDELAFFLATRTPFEKIKTFLLTHQERCNFSAEPGVLVARIAAPASVGAENVLVSLDGSLSSGPAGKTLTYQWTLVDGSALGAAVKNANSVLATLSLGLDKRFADSYALPGDYQVQLTVSDGVNTSEPAFATVKAGFYTAFEKSMLDKVNALRAAEGQGAGPLALNEKLTVAARKYARYMRDNLWFNHTDKDGKNFDTRITAEGYNWQIVGENIGVIKSNQDDVKLTEDSVQFMYNGWKNSPPHYANMIMKEFKEIGIGFSVGITGDSQVPYQMYASQEFGTAR